MDTRKCLMKGCTTNLCHKCKNSATFHKLPAVYTEKCKWLTLINRSDLIHYDNNNNFLNFSLNAPKHMFICNHHFAIDQYDIYEEKS